MTKRKADDELLALTEFVDQMATSYAGLSKHHIRAFTDLLSEGNSVPFIVRYRATQVGCISGPDGHTLSDAFHRHQALATTRAKVLRALDEALLSSKKTHKERTGSSSLSTSSLLALRRLALAATTAGELDDIYAPFKLPSRGTLAERATRLVPGLAEAVDLLWRTGRCSGPLISTATMSREVIDAEKNSSSTGSTQTIRDAAIHLLASKVAALPAVASAFRAHFELCAVVSSKAKQKRSTAGTKFPSNTVGETRGADKKKGSGRRGDNAMLDAYDGFEAPLRRLHSHQVLAIERGKQREYLSVTVAIPSEHKRALKAGVDAVEKETRRELSSWYRRNGDRGSVTEQYRLAQGLIAAAEAEASSSLLKRRAAAAVWRESVGRAKARATAVFANNLTGVLLAPPLRPPRPVMAVDPGHAAGCKCALLDADGHLLERGEAAPPTASLFTVYPLRGRERAISELLSALEDLVQFGLALRDSSSSSSGGTRERRSVSVAVGDGHGSEDALGLVRSVIATFKSAKKNKGGCSDICVSVSVVREAGASVWSASEAAAKEIPGIAPASLGAVSIGRRLQDPLHELIKVPPKSLGIGMYQHDVAEKELEASLGRTTVDAVAIVGVDVNRASSALLSLVPGLNTRLAKAIVMARPLRSRAEIQSRVSGIGPVTFRNAAGFLQVRGAPPSFLSSGEKERALKGGKRKTENKEASVTKWVLSLSSSDLSLQLDATLVHPEDYTMAKRILQVAARKAAKEDTATTTASNTDKAISPSDGSSAARSVVHWLREFVESSEAGTLNHRALCSLDLSFSAPSNKLSLSSSTASRADVPPWFCSVVEDVIAQEYQSSMSSSSNDRRIAVTRILRQLLLSGLDPRLVLEQSSALSSTSMVHSTGESVKRHASNRIEQTIANSTSSCQPLPQKITRSLDSLAAVCPLRNISGQVANSTDFGVFVDIGCADNRQGLLHRSRLSSLTKSTSGWDGIYPGAPIAVDILSVDVGRKRIELALAGAGATASQQQNRSGPISTKQRSSNKMLSSDSSNSDQSVNSGNKKRKRPNPSMSSRCESSAVINNSAKTKRK